MNKTFKEDSIKIISWYKNNQRILPWRENNNPYNVWISEVMLQQTRIEAVIPKYLAFMYELPNIHALASVNDDKLMKLWEGLGYYSRARNLKKCAIAIENNYNGIFPSDKKELMKLPGIGFYTAGAISAISFGNPVSAIDGNVLRVYSRYIAYKEDIRDKEVSLRFSKEIESTIQDFDSDSVRLFTQGIMELGEVICIPNGKPHCDKCPLSNNCKAYKNNLINSIPYKSKLNKRKIINKTVFIIHDSNTYFMHKRDSNGLLANLFEFVNVDKFLKENEVNDYIQNLHFTVISIKKSVNSKHIFTHLEWNMQAYEIEVSYNNQPLDNHYYYLTKEEIQLISIPSAFNAYLKEFHLR